MAVFLPTSRPETKGHVFVDDRYSSGLLIGKKTSSRNIVSFPTVILNRIGVKLTRWAKEWVENSIGDRLNIGMFFLAHFLVILTREALQKSKNESVKHPTQKQETII